MLIIYGIYRFFPRQTAFRNDYCMSCDKPQRAEQIRTLYVFHIYFIPILPLGLWKRWYCFKCGENPNPLRLTAVLIKTSVLALLVFCPVFFWSLYFFVVPGVAEDPPFLWLFGILAPLGAVAMAAHLAVWRPSDPGYRARFQAVPKADDTICPFCRTVLIDQVFECHCPGCGVHRL